VGMTIDNRVAVLERSCDDMKSAIFDIRDSLQVLARLEERHAETRDALGRAFNDIEKMEERVKNIELHLPGLIEMRGWVVMGMLGIAGLVGVALVGLVVTGKAMAGIP